MVGLSSINPDPVIGLDIPCFVCIGGLYSLANKSSPLRKAHLPKTLEQGQLEVSSPNDMHWLAKDLL
jgi:hypothetical protein